LGWLKNSCDERVTSVGLINLETGSLLPAVSRTLVDVGKFAEAEAVCRDTISEFEQMGVDTAGDGGVMSDLRMQMGFALGNQGKDADAQLVFERCVTEFTQNLGPANESTLSAARALGNNLNFQGKHAEAVTILRGARRRAKRALDPENILILQCGLNLGFALTCQKNFDQADAVFREVLPTLKRVLGPHHPLSLQASGKYAECLAGCGRHTEAEVMLGDTVAARARVLGAGHPDTQMSVQMLARVRSSMAMARK
jgi:tetratricopeptide (TPR) repeat protein